MLEDLGLLLAFASDWFCSLALEGGTSLVAAETTRWFGCGVEIVGVCCVVVVIENDSVWEGVLEAVGRWDKVCRKEDAPCMLTPAAFEFVGILGIFFYKKKKKFNLKP